MTSIIAERGGAVPFSEFMALALYHPRSGYYSGSEPHYGREGDFLTAPTASGWYGRVVARVVERLAAAGGAVCFVDLAAGDGSLMATVRAAVEERAARAVDRWIAVEQSPTMQRLAGERCGEGVDIVASLDQAPRPSGTVILHASELYDALPVERVIATAGGLEQFWVAARGNALEWQQRPVDDAVRRYFERHRVQLAPGQVAEACLGACDLHRAHLEWAGEAVLALTLDYGYDARRLYDPRGRAQGSLVCYRRHQLSRDPLADPGLQDITAHVNWDDLRPAARESGVDELGLWPLAEFLVRAGLGDVMEEAGVGMEADLDGLRYAERQEIKRLLDPEGMGSDLKMLVQGRAWMVSCFASAPTG